MWRPWRLHGGRHTATLPSNASNAGSTKHDAESILPGRPGVSEHGRCAVQANGENDPLLGSRLSAVPHTRVAIQGVFGRHHHRIVM
jgi:hypothetical protein